MQKLVARAMAVVSLLYIIQAENPVGTAHFAFGLVVIILQLINVRKSCMAVHGDHGGSLQEEVLLRGSIFTKLTQMS